MKLKKKLLKESHLYLIVDKKISGKNPVHKIGNKGGKSGCDIIQLRDKQSKKEDIIRDAFYIQKILSNTNVLFIINDYIDVAKIVDADGIHLGQDDVSIQIARRLVGRDKIIGISCHNLKQALNAHNQGADYISIGPIFSTATKPEYRPIGLEVIKKIKEKIKIPFFAIGNINEDNIGSVLLEGAERTAICRAILQAKNISLTTKKFSHFLR